LAHRAERIGREVGEMREHGLAGTPQELVDKIETFADVGVTRVYLQVHDLADLEHLEFVAAEVMAKLPG
jgi:alkanesulfonate monooxygenase